MTRDGGTGEEGGGGYGSETRQEMMAPSTVLPRKRVEGRNQASMVKEPGISYQFGTIPVVARNRSRG